MYYIPSSNRKSFLIQKGFCSIGYIPKRQILFKNSKTRFKSLKVRHSFDTTYCWDRILIFFHLFTTTVIVEEENRNIKDRQSAHGLDVEWSATKKEFLGFYWRGYCTCCVRATIVQMSSFSGIPLFFQNYCFDFFFPKIVSKHFEGCNRCGTVVSILWKTLSEQLKR